MRYIAHHPFKYLSLVGVVGFVFQATVIAEPSTSHHSVESLRIQHYIKLLHSTDTLNHTKLVSRFYRAQDHQPVWVGSNQARIRTGEKSHKQVSTPSALPGVSYRNIINR